MAVRVCKDCGSSSAQLSHRGFCSDCSLNRQQKSGEQLRNKNSTLYKKWKKGMKKFIKKLK